mmetsp:Transcript_27322/g.49387  ORF Transcript_27322/g.49387 Transcript_27322/m.49387 type:complete len:102 (+) Transcript_27322:517-822(+)
MLAPFDRKEYPEEAYIRDLDGCKDGCIAQDHHSQSSCWSNLDQPWWLAKGSASVVDADTISNLGYGKNLHTMMITRVHRVQSKHTYEYAKRQNIHLWWRHC